MDLERGVKIKIYQGYQQL